MLVVGLTGGIGSGKTTVAKLFAEKGITVIDTDQLARDVTRPDQPALKQITDQFGAHLLQTDGTLNRSALRKIVFNDENSRVWLEKLLHPLIRAEMQRQVNTAKSAYCIVVIPLLLETERNPLIDRILVIDSPEDDQLKRTQLRDNATEQEIRAILTTQVNRTTRLRAADDIIENVGPAKNLIPQVDRLHGFYTALAQKQPLHVSTLKKSEPEPE
jgi:dephospho-CoA kinase